MSGYENLEANLWLSATLGNDATLLAAAPGGVNLQVAPLNSPTPYVVFGWQAAHDVKTAQATQIFDRLTYRVEVVAPVDQYASIASAVARLSALIDLVRNGSTANANVECWRLNPYERYEQIAGKDWAHIGGLYQILVQYK